jgi:glycosyltransferase involved in cell wall biosynthesis
MKILQIVPSISLIYGGPSQMVLGLSKALAQGGENVTILTTDSNGDTGQLPLDVPLQIPLQQDGYEIIYFRCSPWRRYKFSLDLLNWLYRHASDYDVVHIHALFSPVSTSAAAIARLQKLPYILRPLGTLDPADLQKKRALKQIYGFLLEKPNLAGAGGLHFTSTQEQKISHRYGVETQDFIIPLGVDIPLTLPKRGSSREGLGIAPTIPLILFMSRLDPKKGLDLLLPALSRLRNQGKEFHFVLAGGNPQNPNYVAAIEQEIKNSILKDCTTLAGFVRGEEKYGLLQDADLFVLPSYYENFGIAVAEALGMGLPVIISDQVHIWPEVVNYGAGWVTPCKLEDLTTQLATALDNPLELQQRGQQGRKLAQEEYSWPAIAAQVLAAYGQILTDKPEML